MEKPKLDFVDEHEDRFVHDADKDENLNVQTCFFKEVEDLEKLHTYIGELIEYKKWKQDVLNPVRFVAIPDGDIKGRYLLSLFDSEGRSGSVRVTLDRTSSTTASEEFEQLANEISYHAGGRKVQWTNIWTHRVHGDLLLMKCDASIGNPAVYCSREAEHVGSHHYPGHTSETEEEASESEKCDARLGHSSCSKESGHVGTHLDWVNYTSWP